MCKWKYKCRDRIMKLNRLKETQKLYPHWFDRNYDSNFTKHLRVINEQNLDLHNSVKKLEYSRLLEKPIQIIKEQEQPYWYSLTFRCNIPHIKKITIYKNPSFEDIEDYENDWRFNFKITNNESNYPYVWEYEEDNVNTFEYTLQTGYYTNYFGYIDKTSDYEGYYIVTPESDGVFYENMEIIDEQPVYSNPITPINDKTYKNLINDDIYVYKQTSDDGKYILKNVTEFYEDEELTNLIQPSRNKHYKDINTGKYYEYLKDHYSEIYTDNEDLEAIPKDIFLFKIETHDNYLFYKGFPENDTKDYQIDIEHEFIGDRNILTFTCFAKNIQEVTIKRQPTTEIDKSSFDLFTRTYEKKGRNRFRYVYRLDVGEHLKNYKYSFEVKLFDKNTVLNKEYPESNHDRNALFNHDNSLDIIGAMFNVPRHNYNEVGLTELSKTLPPYNNRLTEDDYHYQERIKYYINHYNKTYFPVLELWKYYGINSELINRYTLISQQDISYQATQDSYGIAEEIEENILPHIINCYYYQDDYDEYIGTEIDPTGFYPNNAVKTGDKLVYDSENPEKSTINLNLYYKVTEIVYYTDDEEAKQNFINTYLGKTMKYNINTSQFEIVENVDETCLTSDGEEKSKLITQTIENEEESDETSNELKNTISLEQGGIYNINGYTTKTDDKCEWVLDNNYNWILKYKNSIDIYFEFYTSKDELISTNIEQIINKEYFSIDFQVPTNSVKAKISLKYVDDFCYKNLSINRIVSAKNREYMRTHTDYNSCVYDLFVDYEDIPSNLKLPTSSEFDTIFKRCFPISKKGFLNIDLTPDSSTTRFTVRSKPKYYISNYIATEYQQISESTEPVLIENLNIYDETIYCFSLNSTNTNKLLPTITFYDDNDNIIDTGLGINTFTTDNVDSAEYYAEVTSPTGTVKCDILIDTVDNTPLTYSNLKFYDKEKRNII